MVFKATACNGVLVSRRSVALVPWLRFSYIVGMGRLLMLQLHRVWIWSRDTMRRIIADIDTDGNGEIDWEEIHGEK